MYGKLQNKIVIIIRFLEKKNITVALPYIDTKKSKDRQHHAHTGTDAS